jgi:hypothetical protein
LDGRSDALEVRDRLDDRNDQPQVTRCRRACREDAAALLVDLDFEVVDLEIVARNLQPEFAVPADNRCDCLRQLRLDEAAHGEDAISQVLDVLVEASRNMTSQSGCFHGGLGRIYLNLNSKSICRRL